MRLSIGLFALAALCYSPVALCAPMVVPVAAPTLRDTVSGDYDWSSEIKRSEFHYSDDTKYALNSPKMKHWFDDDDEHHHGREMIDIEQDDQLVKRVVSGQEESMKKRDPIPYSNINPRKGFGVNVRSDNGSMKKRVSLTKDPHGQFGVRPIKNGAKSLGHGGGHGGRKRDTDGDISMDKRDPAPFSTGKPHSQFGVRPVEDGVRRPGHPGGRRDLASVDSTLHQDDLIEKREPLPFSTGNGRNTLGPFQAANHPKQRPGHGHGGKGRGGKRDLESADVAAVQDDDIAKRSKGAGFVDYPPRKRSLVSVDVAGSADEDVTKRDPLPYGLGGGNLHANNPSFGLKVKNTDQPTHHRGGHRGGGHRHQ